MLRGAPEPGADFAPSRASRIAPPDNLAVRARESARCWPPVSTSAGGPSPAESSACQPTGPDAISNARSSAPWRIPTARLGLLLVSMRHPSAGGASMARDSDRSGPARATASRGAESLPPCRTRANAQLLVPLRGSGLRGRPPQLRDGRGLRAGAMLPACAPAARHRGRHHARARRAVPRRRVPCIAMRCQREEGVGSDSADSAADMPGALSQHDFVSDYAGARAARGRS